MAGMNCFSMESPAFLFELQSAYYRYLLLKSAMGNNIFDILERPRTADQVAEILDRDVEIVLRMLLALEAMGLVEQLDGRFANSVAAGRFCAGASPECLARVIEFNDRCFGEGFRKQAGTLRPSEDSGQWGEAEFVMGMEAGRGFLCAGAVEQVVSLVKALPQFPECRSVLDLGCGSGLLGLGIAGEREDTRLTLVDFPPVLEAIRTSMEECALAGRTSLVGADLFHDNIPGTYDLIIASDSLYGAPVLADCLVRLRALLNPGGVLVLRHLEAPCDGDAAVHDALLRFGGALVGMPGYVFPAGAISKALAEAGLSLEQSLPLSYLGHGYVIHIATT